MKVKFVKKTIGNDTFFIRKYKYHWWQRWKTYKYIDSGRVIRYDYIGGFMYERIKENYDSICLHNLDAPDIVRLEY